MKKARTLLAIWLALILTLTLFPTALATGDGTEPTGGATNNSFTVNVHALEGIANPTQNVENGTWTQGDLVFTFTLTKGYANPSVALTIGDASITNLPLSGPDSDGKYTLTVPGDKITGNVNLRLSAAKEESGEPTTPQGDGTLPPSGEPNTACTVTFQALSGATNIPSPGTVSADGTYKIPDNIPTLSNFLFLDWRDESNGSVYKPGDTITGINSDITLKAYWAAAVDISFASGSDDKDVSNLPDGTKVLLSDGSYTLPTTTPSRPGYIFTGWASRDSYGNNGTGILNKGEMYTFTRTSGYAVTFTAQWSKGVTVNYVKDGGNVGNMPNPSTITVEQGSTITLPSAPSRHDGSYSFSGWKADWNGEMYSAGAKVTLPADKESVTFTAKFSWTAYADYDEDNDKPSKPSKPTYDEYRIRATCSDGGWVSPAGSTYVREGRNLTVTFAPYKGYAIDGVYIDGVLDNRYDGSYTFRDVDENHTIYVRYVRDSGSSGGSSGGGSHWDDDTSPKTGDASAPLSMGLGVGSLALIAFLVARKMRRA